MEGRPQGEQNDQKIHQPEFVVISDEFKESASGGEFQYQSTGQYESFEKLRDIKPSFAVRFAFLLMSLIFYAAAFLGLFILLSLCLLVVVTLGQVKGLNRFTSNYWKTIRKVFVTGSGLLVAVVSPAFGLGIIVLYFILVAGGTNDPVFSKLFESSIYKG